MRNGRCARASRPFFCLPGNPSRKEREVTRAQHAAPLQVVRAKRLGSSGADDTVFEEGDELLGIAGGGETGLARADDGDGFIGGEMGESFFEGASEVELGSFGSNAQNGFAEAIDAVGGGFQGLGSGIVRRAGDNDLDWVMGE